LNGEGPSYNDQIRHRGLREDPTLQAIADGTIAGPTSVWSEVLEPPLTKDVSTVVMTVVGLVCAIAVEVVRQPALQRG
jgi:hypothetical protein